MGQTKEPVPLSPSNEDLLARYQQSDMEGFELFYRRHQSLVFGYLLNRLGGRAEAEEAFQETWLRLHSAILSFDPRQNALAWLLTIARNVAHDILRKRRHHQTFRDEQHGLATEIGTSTAEAALLARNALSHIMAVLTSDERALIESRFLLEEDYDAIASHRQIGVDLARQKVSRLLKKIRAR